MINLPIGLVKASQNIEIALICKGTGHIHLMVVVLELNITIHLYLIQKSIGFIRAESCSAQYQKLILWKLLYHVVQFLQQVLVKTDETS